MSMYLAAITLAGNLLGGQSSTNPAIPTTVTQVCAGGCVQVDLGNVKLFPNGCMVFTPSLQAPGPFTATNICPDGIGIEDFFVINGTRNSGVKVYDFSSK